MTDLERFRAVMRRQPVDRCVYGVWTGGWPETYERWKLESGPPRPRRCSRRSGMVFYRPLERPPANRK